MVDEGRASELWNGRDLFDLEGGRIGLVEDVIYGEITGEPEWLVVRPEAAGEEKSLVPVAEVRRSSERLSVNHMKARVAGAPKVDDASALTEADKGKLCRYYGLMYVSPSGEAPADGCVEMPDKRPGG